MRQSCFCLHINLSITFMSYLLKNQVDFFFFFLFSTSCCFCCCCFSLSLSLHIFFTQFYACTLTKACFLTCSFSQPSAIAPWTVSIMSSARHPLLDCVHHRPHKITIIIACATTSIIEMHVQLNHMHAFGHALFTWSLPEAKMTFQSCHTSKNIWSMFTTSDTDIPFCQLLYTV